VFCYNIIVTITKSTLLGEDSDSCSNGISSNTDLGPAKRNSDTTS